MQPYPNTEQRFVMIWSRQDAVFPDSKKLAKLSQSWIKTQVLLADVLKHLNTMRLMPWFSDKSMICMNSQVSWFPGFLSSSGHFPLCRGTAAHKVCRAAFLSPSRVSSSWSWPRIAYSLPKESRDTRANLDHITGHYRSLQVTTHPQVVNL